MNAFIEGVCRFPGRGRKRNMASGMPILRKYRKRHPFQQLIGYRYDFIATGNRKGTPWTKIVLYIDDNQG
jgi:hypothetical protein